MDCAPLFLFTLFWKFTYSIKCYKCEPEWVSYNPAAQLCKDFDGSEQFITECQYSTMCSKRQMQFKLNSGLDSEMSVEMTQRGCALQTLSGDQKKINGKWQQVKDIYEVYEENCKQDLTDEKRITKTTHCFCRGNLCNGSFHMKPPSILSIFIFGYVAFRVLLIVS